MISSQPEGAPCKTMFQQRVPSRLSELFLHVIPFNQEKTCLHVCRRHVCVCGVRHVVPHSVRSSGPAYDLFSEILTANRRPPRNGRLWID